MSHIRILSLDGGGALAGILAVALGRIYGEDTPGRDIIRQFDIVAGNSGGSIVMTALCCNHAPKDIAALYADPSTVEAMFCPRWTSVFKGIAPLRILLPPYSSRGKFEALKRLFDRAQRSGEPPPSTIALTDWPAVLGHNVRLIVTAYDYDTEKAAFFRSDTNSRTQSSAPHVDATLAEAVHASTNAPIYFYGEPAHFRGRRYWDGGLAGYNNPVLAGVIEAMANFPDRREDIRVLSIGTGLVMQAPFEYGVPPPLGAPQASTSLLTAIGKAARAVLADPPGAASFHAYVASGQPLPIDDHPLPYANVVRMCPCVRPIFEETSNQWRLPAGLSMGEFEQLLALPSDAMSGEELALIGRMGALWVSDAVLNQPIRMGLRMQCDIGDATFSEALARWRSIA